MYNEGHTELYAADPIKSTSRYEIVCGDNKGEMTLLNLDADILQLLGINLETRIIIRQVHRYFRNIFQQKHESDMVAVNHIFELVKSLSYCRQQQIIMNSLLNKINIQLVEVPLTELDCQGVVQIIKHNPTLQKLELYKNRLNNGDLCAHLIAECLPDNTVLHTLELWYNNIGDMGVKSIATALQSNAHLQTLQLGMNQVSDTGAKDLGNALKINKTLKVLGLYDNTIGDCGAKDLAECLLVNTTLQKLWLGLNDIKNHGVHKLASSLNMNTTIKELSLDDNPVDKALIDKLVSKHQGRISYSVCSDSD